MISDRYAVEKLDFAVKMLKDSETSRRAVTELISGAVSIGPVYSSGGSASVSQVGANLNTTA